MSAPHSSWLARLGQWLFGGNMLEGTAKAVFWVGVYVVLLTVLLDLLRPG
ncbi:hypothetical protein KQ945_15150 [Bacillus subtilis subsp. subtilis]|nr:hypothetical protein [Bacillus subtilis subsp. subtilis]